MSLTRTIEIRIAAAVIEELLKVGPISVQDGEDVVLVDSTNPQKIIHAMFSTDEDRLFVKLPNGARAWVWFVWGNGEDCLTDHTVNLEDILKPVTDKLENGELP